MNRRQKAGRTPIPPPDTTFPTPDTASATFARPAALDAASSMWSNIGCWTH
jgi:hypothetical protein